ncbi:carboxypeptidase regulatory-like domain-containing protein [Nannocystaceae bacterium ST9]
MLPCFLLAHGWSASAGAAPPEGEGETGDGFDFDEGDDEGDFDDADVVEEVIVAPEGPAEGETETETPPSDDESISPDDGFVFEDISEDQEALDEELKSGEVQAKGQTGTIQGVIHNAKGEPLAGVYVRAKGTDYVARTGVDGKFELKLPAGSHTLSIELDLYKSNEIAGVSVKVGETASQDVELVPMAGVQETYAVEDNLNLEAEGALQEMRKKSTKVSDGLDATEIGKSGGGKVSSVAVRIVGATVVDGRYLVVRGLGHRYGNTLLDRARVPSPEPDLRTVPLDVFPSGALGAIDVQKTFTPDVPGDFTGGSTQMLTRDVPSETTVKLGAAVGFNTNTTFQPMITNGPFPGADLFGFGNIPRQLPTSFPKGQKVGRGVYDENFNEVYTPAQIEAQGEAMYTDYRVRRGSKAPANFKLSATLGDSWATNRPGGRIGVLFSGGYSNRHQTNYGHRNQLSSNGGVLTNSPASLDMITTVYKVAFNGLLVTRWDIDSNNWLKLTGLYSRDAEDETSELSGVDRANNGVDPIVYNRIRYIMRSIAFTQLSGHHRIERAANLEIDWFGSYSQAQRDDPAMRELIFRGPDPEDGSYRVDDSTGGVGPQLFLDFVDHNENAALDFTVPFKQWKGLDSKFKFGAWIDGKQRGFRAHRYYFSAAGFNDLIPEGRGNVINDSTIGGGIPVAQGGDEPFTLIEATRAQDNYDAWSRNVSGYGMLDLPFVNWFKISGGLRVESNVIDVNPFDIYAMAGAPPDPTLKSARLVDLDFLPALSLIFSPKLKEGRGDLNIRLTGSRTLARPEFRELTPFLFRDYVAGFDKIGNPDLTSTKIWNGDVRIEWFPRKNEVLALSGFVKQMQAPIEVMSSPTYALTWQNIDRAINAGGELELRKSIDFLAPKANTRARQVLRDFSIGGNVAVIYSDVEVTPCVLPGNETPGYVVDPDCREEFQPVNGTVHRPLQGQAPWIANAFLDYDNGDTGTNVRLLYNGVGRSLYAVGAQSLPNIYTRRTHQLDLVVSQRLFAYKRNGFGDLRNELSLTFEVNNIFNTRKQLEQGLGSNLGIVRTTRDGLDMWIGLQWQY